MSRPRKLLLATQMSKQIMIVIILIILLFWMVDDSFHPDIFDPRYWDSLVLNKLPF
jgi:hypothetical protein